MRKYIIPSITLFFSLLPLIVLAQNCGCADEGNCPFDITPNSTSQVCYTIDAAVNNDLGNANQGVCGVSISFKHGNIGNLNLTLTSPNGTSIELVGSDNNCLAFTPISTWDLLFVPCADDCDPVSVNNCDDNCAFDACCGWGNALYSATYHPYQGCLEDFNSGPVNGQWCIDIDNDPSNNGGDIFDFEIILCDDTGIFCCDADAGGKLNPDDAVCEGDSSLIFDLEPVWGIIQPDTSLYDYTYIVSENDVILEYTNDPSLFDAGPGIYEVCGLSYLEADEPLIPAPGTMSLSDLDENLEGLTPMFCGDIDGCFTIVISAPPPPINLIDTICENDCLMVGDTCISESGNHTLTIESFAGCDSVINLNLTLLEADTTTISATICQGNTFIVGDSIYSESGIDTTLLVSSFGCDSVVISTLTVLPPSETNLNEMLCLGDSIQVGDSLYFESGMYSDTLSSFNGCDSIVNLNLTIITLNIQIAEPDTLSCTEAQITLDASGSSMGLNANYSWTTDNGTFVSPTNELTAQVTQSAWYYFTIEENGCERTDSVFVLENIDAPQIVVAEPDTLNCLIQSVTLDASNTTGGGTLTFQWTSSNSFPIDNSNTPNPTVFNPDIYQLLVVNEDNGCADSLEIEVFQNIEQPIANAGNNENLTCTDTCLTLNGTGSSPLSLLEFEWSGMGVKSGENTPNPIVNLEGTYELIVTNTDNFCKDTTQVFIGTDTIAPVAIINLPLGDTLTCLNDELTLNGNNSIGQNLNFQWFGDGLSSNNLPTTTANLLGEYKLIIQNGTNGCVDSTSINIGQDTISPSASAGPPIELDCGLPTYVLGSTSSQNPNETYAWTTSDGHFVDSPNQLNPTIDSAGTYILVVTNILNGCTAQDSVSILEDFALPIADAGPDGIIDCDNPIYTLDASNTTLAGTMFSDTILFSFEWEAFFNPDFRPEFAVVSVNFPDTFVVEVTHITSQCTDKDTVIVTQDVLPPQIDAGDLILLDCDLGEADLNGSITFPTSNFDFDWSTQNGSFVGTPNTLNPTIDQVGTYFLQVTDLTTNCVAIDSVFAMIDSSLCTPFVFAGEDSLINCYCQCTQITIDADGSVGSNFSYEWTNLNGDILPQSDPFAPSLPDGTFIFTITNDEVNLSASDTIFIGIDTLHPVVSLPSLIQQTCPELEECTPVDVSNVPFGMNFCYEWENAGGEICTDPTIRNAEIRGVGIYSLIVTDKNNGCASDASTALEIIGNVPQSNAGMNQELECGDSTAVLDCSNSIFDGNDILEWYSNDGTFLSTTDICNPSVQINTDADEFFLVITDTENLCSDTSSLTVFAAPDCFPNCNAGPDMSLTCDIDTVWLDGFASPVDTNICIQWTALSGNILDGDTTLNPCIDEPGFYRISVTRKVNGAEFTCTDEVQVQGDTLPPNVGIEDPDDLTCVVNCVTLIGSPTGSNLVYDWSTSDGNFKSATNIPNPEADQIGTYTLTVTNTENGCSDSQSVTVEENTQSPNAVISPNPPPDIDCDGNPITLSSSGSSSGSFLWTTTDGNIITNPPTSGVIQVDAAGEYCLTVTNLGSGCTDVVCVNVGVNEDAPECSIADAPNFICGIDEIQLEGIMENDPFLEFEWTTSDGDIPNPNTLTPTITEAGTYVFTVTNPLNNCKCTSSVTLLDDTMPPLANAGSDEEIDCQNQEVTLSGQGSQPSNDIIYQWFLNSVLVNETISFETNLTGIYELVVTDTSNQCTDSDLVEVTIDQNFPVAYAGEDTTFTCTRENVDLSSFGSTSGQNILQIWQAPNGDLDTTNILTATQLGDYILTVFDTTNQCEIFDTVRIELDTISPNAVIDTSLNLEITCDSTFVILDASASGSTDSLIFKWDNNMTGPVISVTQPGGIGLTVCHERTGCINSTFVEVGIDTIAPMISLAAPEKLTCDVRSIQILAIPNDTTLNYIWSGGICDSLCTTASPWVSEATTYKVEVENPENGCTTEAFIVVEQDVVPPIAVANANGNIDCVQNEVTLSGEGSSVGNVSYFWSTTGTGIISSPTFLNTEANAQGWYFLTVTSGENGCESTDSIQVIASAVPIDSIQFLIDQPDCRDPDGYVYIDSVFGGTPDFIYSIGEDIFIPYPQFQFLPTGSYDLTIEDVNGCRFDTTIIIEMPDNIVLNIDAEVELLLGDSTTLTLQTNLTPEAIDTIIWNPLPNMDCPGCIEQGIRPQETSRYEVTVIDTNSCRASTSIMIFVSEELPVYIPNAFSPNGDGNNDHFIIYGDNDKVKIPLLQIFDRWGNMVYEAENFSPNDPNFGWDGVYQGKFMNAQVLVWKAEIELWDGRIERVTGDLTLIR